jgi:hypothetical protein
MALYNCRETFTDVMSALQIKLFLQNKANFRKSQMNVTKVLTKDYGQMDTWSIGKKQSQTNPNKAKLKKAKMNVTSALTKEYENKPPIRAPKKQSQFKPNLSRRSLWRRRKQTQFQTSFTLCEPFLFFTFLCPGYNSVKLPGQEQAESGSADPADYLSSNIEVQYRYEC